jgi:hypothetical protein
MLSPLDDFPFHQISEPMRHVGTSDRGFYDRYYFNCFPINGDSMMIMGLGQYPNLGVTDAFALQVHGSSYRVLRSSRELGLDRRDTAIGPLSVEIVEPLKQVRFKAEPNEHGFSFDVLWRGSHTPVIEEPHRIRELGRLMFDTSRFAQLGTWEGSITIDGATTAVTPDSWVGSRDRSWGVRPGIGEPEPQGIRASLARQFFWMYCPVRFDDFALVWICQEAEDGSRILEDAKRIWYADGRVEHLGRPEHDVVFTPGSRNFASAVIRAGSFEATAEPMKPAFLSIGTGYGYESDWRHGMYQGPLVTQGMNVDVATEEGRRRMFGICDASARFTTNDGHVGYGLFETMAIGPHARYGLTGLMDPFTPNL